MKIKDRIILGNILPAQGSFTDMTIIQDIKKKVTLSQKEIEDFEIVTGEGGNIGWNPEKDKDVKIEFTKQESNIIKRTLQDLDKESKITPDLISLYETYCLTGSEKKKG